jgi:hypothetical protein
VLVFHRHLAPPATRAQAFVPPASLHRARAPTEYANASRDISEPRVPEFASRACPDKEFVTTAPRDQDFVFACPVSLALLAKVSVTPVSTEFATTESPEPEYARAATDISDNFAKERAIRASTDSATTGPPATVPAGVSPGTTERTALSRAWPAAPMLSATMASLETASASATTTRSAAGVSGNAPRASTDFVPMDLTETEPVIVIPGTTEPTAPSPAVLASKVRAFVTTEPSEMAPAAATLGSRGPSASTPPSAPASSARAPARTEFASALPDFMARTVLSGAPSVGLGLTWPPLALRPPTPSVGLAPLAPIGITYRPLVPPLGILNANSVLPARTASLYVTLFFRKIFRKFGI